VIACGFVFSGCSIGAEESPRTWSSWDRFEEPPESSALGVERIYLLSTQDTAPTAASQLTTVKRDIDKNVNSYRAILDVLFKGPTSEETAQGLKSNIPVGLSVIADPKFEQGTVLVDFSEELTTSFGGNLVDALAQIVWTLCERPGTRQVRILVEGRQLSWPRADGGLVDRPLTPFDYPTFAITSQPDFPGIIRS
jgi:spore germination protein GerM